MKYRVTWLYLLGRWVFSEFNQPEDRRWSFFDEFWRWIILVFTCKWYTDNRRTLYLLGTNIISLEFFTIWNCVCFWRSTQFVKKKMRSQRDSNTRTRLIICLSFLSNILSMYLVWVQSYQAYLMRETSILFSRSFAIESQSNKMEFNMSIQFVVFDFFIWALHTYPYT